MAGEPGRPKDKVRTSAIKVAAYAVLGALWIVLGADRQPWAWPSLVIGLCWMVLAVVTIPDLIDALRHRD